MTKFAFNLCFTVHYFYPKISSFKLVLSIVILLFWTVFSCTCSILKNSQLECDVCRLHKHHSKSLYIIFIVISTNLAVHAHTTTSSCSVFILVIIILWIMFQAGNHWTSKWSTSNLHLSGGWSGQKEIFFLTVSKGTGCSWFYRSIIRV